MLELYHHNTSVCAVKVRLVPADNVLEPLLLGRGVDAPMPIILIGALGGMVTSRIIGLFVGAVLPAVGYRIFIEWVDMAKREPIANRRSPVRERHQTSLVTVLGRATNENQRFRPPWCHGWYQGVMATARSAALLSDIAQREPAIFVQLGPVGGQAI